MGVILITFLVFFTFNFPKIYTSIGLTLLLLLLLARVFKKEVLHMKIVNVSIALMIFMNFGLNSYFYPELLMYQAGIPMSKLIHHQFFKSRQSYWSTRKRVPTSHYSIKKLHTKLHVWSPNIKRKAATYSPTYW